jgi:hypothetical protein
MPRCLGVHGLVLIKSIIQTNQNSLVRFGQKPVFFCQTRTKYQLPTQSNDEQVGLSWVISSWHITFYFTKIPIVKLNFII